jgi:hypothetical protein
VPGFVGSAATRVGIFGNADPLATQQWIELVKPGVTPSTSFDDALRMCLGVVSGVHLQLLYTRVGEINNPQYKVIAAQQTYLTDNWQYASEDPAGAAEPFFFTTAVSFHLLEDKALDTFVPGPPKVVSLPHDLFYPFDIPDLAGNRRAVSSAAGTPLALLAVLLALGQML